MRSWIAAEGLGERTAWVSVRRGAEWLAEHEHPVEATRHTEAAESWDLATRLLADN